MFIVLAWTQLAEGVGQGTIFTTEPLMHPGVELSAVLTGATVVCFSFIGFDAITNYTEEARDSNTVPRAIMLTVLIASMINFGALIAFTFVNLSVPAHFVFRERRYKTVRDVVAYLVLPVIGAALTGLLWSFLHVDAFIAGLAWCAIGFVYMLLLTNGFRTRIVTLDDQALERA